MSAPSAPLDPARCLASLSRASQAMLEMHNWYDGVDHLLAALGEAMGVSRVWIFQLLEVQPQAVVQDYVFEWASAPRYRQLAQQRFRFFSSSLDDPEYRRLVEERQAGRRHDFCIPAMAAGPLRANLESQGILSMATVPIRVNGQWWGTLGVDDCEQAVSWEGPGLDLLTAASELIAAALNRHQLTSRSRQIELFHKVADCSVWEVSLRNGRVWCSEALKRALGYPATYPRIALRRMLSRIHREDRQQLWHWLRECRDQKRSQVRLDLRLHLGQRGWVWHELAAEIQHSDAGRPRSVAGLLLDISRRKQTEQAALEASEVDALTGVLNRRGMARHLRESEESEGRRHLIVFDIDHFKRINDTYGHPAGDSLLRLLARRIQHELRPGDALVRLGGEEFAVIVIGLDDAQAEALAERLRLSVHGHPFQLDGATREEALSVELSISLGIAGQASGRSGQDVELNTLMAQADQALYLAKRRGRNRTCWHLPHTTASVTTSQAPGAQWPVHLTPKP